MNTAIRTRLAILLVIALMTTLAFGGMTAAAEVKEDVCEAAADVKEAAEEKIDAACDAVADTAAEIKEEITE